MVGSPCVSKPERAGRLTQFRLLANQVWGRRRLSIPFSLLPSRTTRTTDAVTRSRLTKRLRSRSRRPNLKRSFSKVGALDGIYTLQMVGLIMCSVRLTVIDTPGFGDYVNNQNSWLPIIEFLDDQHESYMLQEQQPRRIDKIDLRVHACLYFIRPTGHTLKPLDIEVMKRLSSRVNLIPVVAKADTLSPVDLARFKQRVCEDNQQNRFLS